MFLARGTFLLPASACPGRAATPSFWNGGNLPTNTTATACWLHCGPFFSPHLCAQLTQNIYLHFFANTGTPPFRCKICSNTMPRAQRSVAKAGATGASDPPTNWTDAEKKTHAALAVIAGWLPLGDAAQKVWWGVLVTILTSLPINLDLLKGISLPLIRESNSLKG